MDDYNFIADLLATFRASPDFVKALWLLVPPGSLIGLIVALRLRKAPSGYQVEILPPEFDNRPQPPTNQSDLLANANAPALEHLMQGMRDMKRP